MAQSPPATTRVFPPKGVCLIQPSRPTGFGSTALSVARRLSRDEVGDTEVQCKAIGEELMVPRSESNWVSGAIDLWLVQSVVERLVPANVPADVPCVPQPLELCCSERFRRPLQVVISS